MNKTQTAILTIAIFCLFKMVENWFQSNKKIDHVFSQIFVSAYEIIILYLLIII